MRLERPRPSHGPDRRRPRTIGLRAHPVHARRPRGSYLNRRRRDNSHDPRGAALLVDHVWLVHKRDLLQSAADSASIAATLELARITDSPSDADRDERLWRAADRYVQLNLIPNLGGEPKDLTLDLAVDESAGTVDVQVSADIGSTLLTPLLYDYFGPGEIAVAARTEHERTGAEVVLAIDSSASMIQDLDGHSAGTPRLDIVKAAAKDLVDLLEPSEVGPVAVGLVPWGDMVRLSAGERSNWRDKGWAAFATRRHYRWPYRCIAPCTATPIVQDIPPDRRESWEGCLDDHRILDDGAADLGPVESLSPPGDEAFAEAQFPSGASRAFRCFGDDAPQNFFLQQCWDADSASGTGQIPMTRPQRRCRNAPSMHALSTDGPAVKAAIDGLGAFSDKTYSALGVQWGRRLLAHGWGEVWGDAVHPVDTSEAPYSDLRKILVLLTDGEDNMCDDSADPDCRSGVATLRAAACTAAKHEGVEIFVVAAMAPRLVSGSLGRDLRDCASSPEHVYINNPNAPALREAFRSIASKLLAVRRVS